MLRFLSSSLLSETRSSRQAPKLSIFRVKFDINEDISPSIPAHLTKPPTMDFASLMSTEITKSRPNPPPNSSTNSSDSTKKYLKRADLEAQRQQAYLDDQNAIQREREARFQKKRNFEEEEAARNHERDGKRRRLAEESRIRREEEEDRKERTRRKRLGLPNLLIKDSENAEGTSVPEGDEHIGEEELIAKLRALHEPAILFGETHKQRLRRYRRITDTSLFPAQTNTPIPTTLALLPEAEMKVPPSAPTDPAAREFLFRQLASYFTMVLTEWSLALNQRTEDVKTSFQGKQAMNAMLQSRENMRPLFRKFEKGELEEGILDPVVEIVHAAQERRYVDANDGYLRLSIGKA